MKKKVIFSGIQPSGNLHIGNYIGAIHQWVKQQDADLQNETQRIFCIVDLHAVTVYQDPKVLHEKILEGAALYMACGIDPKKSTIFVQSDNPDHSYLAWLFDCVIPFSWMTHMTQFKDKSAKQKDGTSVGLLNYPALMAADILLYDTTDVPVGEDQTQHIELTCDIANRFNKTYGQTFVLPNPMIDKNAARIMSLQNPEKKMSKSDHDPKGTINMLDSEDDIMRKIKSAVTDSKTVLDGEMYSDDFAADGVSNLLSMYSVFKDITFKEAVKENDGKKYGIFKNDLAELAVNYISNIQTRYYSIRSDQSYLTSVLEAGKEKVISTSTAKVTKVRELMGLYK